MRDPIWDKLEECFRLDGQEPPKTGELKWGYKVETLFKKYNFNLQFGLMSRTEVLFYANKLLLKLKEKEYE